MNPFDPIKFELQATGPLAVDTRRWITRLQALNEKEVDWYRINLIRCLERLAR